MSVTRDRVRAMTKARLYIADFTQERSLGSALASQLAGAVADAWVDDVGADTHTWSAALSDASALELYSRPIAVIIVDDLDALAMRPPTIVRYLKTAAIVNPTRLILAVSTGAISSGSTWMNLWGPGAPSPLYARACDRGREVAYDLQRLLGIESSDLLPAERTR